MGLTSGVIYHMVDFAGFTRTATPTYNHAVTTAAGHAGSTNFSTSIGSLSVYTDTLHPETQNYIEGWKWDERKWSDTETENLSAYVPPNYDAITSGLSETSFQCGIGDNLDLEVVDIVEVPASGIHRSGIEHVWAPEINHGYFYDFATENYLYSDDSEVYYPTYSSIVGGIPQELNLIQLNSFPKVGIPITASTYNWDTLEGSYEIYQEWNKKAEFTGILSPLGEREDTYNDITGEIYWPLIDTALYEFIVSYSGVTNDTGLPEIVFNQQVVDPVGYTGDTILFSGLEILGLSTGGPDQEFHFQYSPIDENMMIRVFSCTTIPSGVLGAIVVASGVDGYGISDGGVIYSGIIENGYLSVEVTEWLARSLGTSYSGYVVNIDYDLGLAIFGDSDLGELVPKAGEYILAAYYRTVRLEYEPEHTGDTVLATEASLNPIGRHSGSGFIYLSTHLEDPATVVLDVELPEITTNYFGPLNIGNNYAAVVATVYDSQGNTLEDEAVTIFITSTPTIGSFGAIGTSTQSITDQNGQARAYFLPPRTVSDIGEEIFYPNFSIDPTPTYHGVTETTTLRTSNLLIEGTGEDVYLFQTQVDDPLLGFVETSIDQTDLDVQLTEYYRQFLLEQNIHGPTGLNDFGIPNNYLTNQTWEDVHRMLLGLARPSIYQRGTGAGKHLLCAMPDVFALNPHTLDPAGFAWAPMRPIDILEQGTGVYDLVYDTSVYSLPTPSGSHPTTSSGTLMSYFVVAPTSVEIQASVYSELAQRTIYSNSVEIKLDIPDYMNGLWTLDSLSELEIQEVNALLAGVVASGQRIPLGFRLRSSHITLAGALDGVTFLDVNPLYNADIWDVDEVPPARHKVLVGPPS